MGVQASPLPNRAATVTQGRSIMRIVKTWNETEINYLISNYKKITLADIAKDLNRSWSSVRCKAYNLGLRLSKEEMDKKYKRAIRILHKHNGSQKGEKNNNWKGGISKDIRREYERRRKEKHPDKIIARKKINHEIRKGRINRGVCEKCGKEKAEAHHEDYSQPLKVIWLCTEHHRELHKMKKNK